MGRKSIDEALQATRREAAEEAARKADRELPPLTGSPARIARAEGIRAERVAQLRALQLRLAVVHAPGREAAVARAKEMIAERIGQSDANFWISTRHVELDPDWIAEEVRKAMGPLEPADDFYAQHRVDAFDASAYESDGDGAE